MAKRYDKAREGIDRDKLYALDEAVKLVKERAKAKFDETIEVAMNLGVDPRHADQMVRGVVNLPNGTGRTVRVGVFARGAKADEAKAAGADIVGAEDLVEKVNGGKIDFDRCIATPDMMPLVGRLGKVLGPRGMMPNPKVGTVTMDVANAVKGAKGGSVEFRVEKAGIVQAGVGKASFTADALVQNIKAFADAVSQGQARRRQGHVHQEDRGLLDHGPGREGRAGSLFARLMAEPHKSKGRRSDRRPFGLAGGLPDFPLSQAETGLLAVHESGLRAPGIGGFNERFRKVRRRCRWKSARPFALLSSCPRLPVPSYPA